MIIETGTVKFYCRVLVIFSFFLVAAYSSIYLLTNYDDMAVQQFRFKTKDGVQYTITIDKYIDNKEKDNKIKRKDKRGTVTYERFDGDKAADRSDRSENACII